MTTSPYRLPFALPPVRRAQGEGALAGVCAGIAKSLGVDVTLVRLTFALLAFAGGAGIVAYAGAWLGMAPEDGPEPSSRRRASELSASPNIAPMSDDSRSRSIASVRSHWTMAVVLTVEGMVRAGSRWLTITEASG